MQGPVRKEKPLMDMSTQTAVPWLPFRQAAMGLEVGASFLFPPPAGLQ